MGFGVGVGARGSQLFYLAFLWRMDGGGWFGRCANEHHANTMELQTCLPVAVTH